MSDISSGRYWNAAWQLIDGCTPCSPGCLNCWSAAMSHRFKGTLVAGERHFLTTKDGEFNGHIVTHPERLSIPLKRRKPTVYAVWNDFFHGAIDHSFRCDAYKTMMRTDYRHTYLILTKRADFAAQYAQSFNNIWHGLTVCNQAEADAKIPVFLQVPGKRFLSIEPMLGAIQIAQWLDPWRNVDNNTFACIKGGLLNKYQSDSLRAPIIGAVILGGETGPGARPLHPDWVRSVRDQCAAAGVPFFFKGWGEWLSEDMQFIRVGRKQAGRLLDGRTHDDLPWVRKEVES